MKIKHIALGVLWEAYQQWKVRPNRLRDWHVICTFGGSNFVLRKTAEKDLLQKLAPGYRIVYIDVARGFVFVDDKTGPAAKT